MNQIPIYKCNKCKHIFETNDRAPNCPHCKHLYITWLNYKSFDVYTNNTIQELIKSNHEHDIPKWTTKQIQQAYNILKILNI